MLGMCRVVKVRMETSVRPAIVIEDTPNADGEQLLVVFEPLATPCGTLYMLGRFVDQDDGKTGSFWSPVPLKVTEITPETPALSPLPEIGRGGIIDDPSF